MQMVGFASRCCFELNLHKRETYSTLDADLALFQKTLFCCVCVLEHRLAFGTQMPYLTRYCDIDEAVLDIVRAMTGLATWATSYTYALPGSLAPILGSYAHL